MRATLEHVYLAKTFGTPINVTHYRAGDFRKHYHDFFEIMVVNADSGRQEINGVSFPLKRGSIFFLSTFHSHRIIAASGSPCDYYNITFKPEAIALARTDLEYDFELAVLKPFFRTDPVRALEPPPHDFDRIVTICELMVAELAAPDRFVAHVVLHLLNALLARLARYDPFAVRDKKEETVLRATALINTRFAEDVSNREIADILGVSSSRLSQLFKEVTGKTVKDVLVSRRVMEAKRLLATTERPIKQIVYDAGFNDASYFVRAFRSAVGASPSAYRQRSR